MAKAARHVFTSESVTEGHPDKVADQISDAVLDAILSKDPAARVACETMVTTGMAVVAGEITTDTYMEYDERFRWLVFPALGLVLLEVLLLGTRFRNLP